MNVRQLMNRRVLGDRSTVPLLHKALEQEAMTGVITLDLVGVDGMSPSFFDELLIRLAELSTSNPSTKIMISSVPTRLSPKFVAIGWSHGLAIDEREPGEWLISSSSSHR
jgi:hypothetical protein